jgi:hypothetical protein
MTRPTDALKVSAYTLHWQTKAEVVARIECEHSIALVLAQGLADDYGTNVDLVHEATGERVKLECEGVRIVREVREERLRAALGEGLASGDPLPHDEVFARVRERVGLRKKDDD